MFTCDVGPDVSVILPGAMYVMAFSPILGETTMENGGHDVIIQTKCAVLYVSAARKQ